MSISDGTAGPAGVYVMPVKSRLAASHSRWRKLVEKCAAVLCQRTRWPLTAAGTMQKRASECGSDASLRLGVHVSEGGGSNQPLP